MGISDEIMNAIGAHGAWKMRLKLAIDNGKSEFEVSAVQQDNQCPFGQWLYDCPPAIKASAQYEKVRQIHARFHKEAANTLLLALSKNKAEAQRSVDSGGAFTRASSELTSALMAWKNEVQG